MSETSKLDTFIEDGFKIHPAKDIPPAGKQAPVIEDLGAADLLSKEFPPLVEPVEGLIVEGETLLVGKPKIGKSILVMQMCACVATGKPFLGRKTQQGTVLYMALEDGDRRLQNRLQQIDKDCNDNLRFHKAPITMDEGLFPALEDWISKHPNAVMVVIDTAKKVRGTKSGRANLYDIDVDEMSRLKAFADRHHIAVVLIHHFNKMRQTRKDDDPFERISGSNGLMGTADTTILMLRDRDSNNAVLTYQGRDVFGDDINISFDPDSLSWQLVDKAAIQKKRYSDAPVVKAVKAYVTATPALINGSGDKLWKVQTDAFREWANDHGHYLGINAGDVTRTLRDYQSDLYRHDGIIVHMDKRVGNARGFHIVLGRGDTP